MQVQFVNKGQCPYKLEDLQQIVLWKIFNYNKIVESYLCNYTSINNKWLIPHYKLLFNCQDEKGLAYLDDLEMYKKYLLIESYVLPMGLHVLYFQLLLSNNLTGVRTSDFYLVRIFSISFFNI